MNRRRNVFLAVAAVSFFVGLGNIAARAQTPPPAAAPAAPAAAAGEVPVAEPVPAAQGGVDEVVVGVFVNQIHEFSLRDNAFTVDFYVWFRWKNPELKPYETFSVLDGRIESRTDPIVKDLPSGEKHAYSRVVAKVTRFFDIRDYPLDNHQLSIIIEEEDSEIHKLVYRADDTNSAASPGISLPGWAFHRLFSTAGVGTYHSNFGDTSLKKDAEASYARLTTAVAFNRVGSTFFFKLFFGLFACVLLSILGFFIKPMNVDPRFGVGVGALFGAIASQYTVASSLPDSNTITLADQIHLVAFFFIIVSVTQSTISLWLWEQDKQDASKKLDKAFRFGAPIAFILSMVVLLNT